MRKRIVITTAFIGILTSIYFLGRNTRPEKITVKIAPATQSPAVVVTAPQATQAPTQPTVVPVVPPPPVQASTASPKEAELIIYKPLIQRYAVLKKKILKTDEEKQENSDLLNNAQLLMITKKFLLKMPNSPDDIRTQNESLDLVIDALAAGQSVAVDVLSAVVADKTVESGKGTAAQQKTIAGVKAEALYLWSSQRPDHVEQIEALLPGPISKKIWDNVKQEQASNIAESEYNR